MYMRNRYFNPGTDTFTQSDPIGIAGGLNTYGFAAGDPILQRDPFGLKADTVPPDFQAKLGDMCDNIDCNAANINVVGWVPDDAGLTIGNEMYFGRQLSSNNARDVALVAHEHTHVGENQKQPSGLSVVEAVTTFLVDTFTGIDVYKWKQYPLGSWQQYNYESRAQIVQDCFRAGSGSLACQISPYHPPNYDPSAYAPGNP